GPTSPLLAGGRLRRRVDSRSLLTPTLWSTGLDHGSQHRRYLVTHCRQAMLEELQRRNFAPTTISSYLHAVEQFARHFKCRPDRLNQSHFRTYQAYLLRERKMQPLTVRLHV